MPLCRQCQGFPPLGLRTLTAPGFTSTCSLNGHHLLLSRIACVQLHSLLSANSPFTGWGGRGHMADLDTPPKQGELHRNKAR